MEFDRESLGIVLKRVGAKVTPAEFIDMYSHAKDLYDYQALKEMMNYDVVVSFRTVYDFRGANWIAWRNQIVDFISKNKEFFNRSPNVILDRLKKENERLNRDRAMLGQPLVPYINYWPQYGGILQDPTSEKRRRVELLHNLGMIPPFNDGDYVQAAVEHNNE